MDKELAKPSTINTPVSKTRKHSEISPDPEELTVKKQCQKSIEMNEELSNFIQEIRSELSSFMKEIRTEYSMLTGKIDDINRKFDEKIEKMEGDIKDVKDGIINIKAEIIPLEEITTELDTKVNKFEIDINILNQTMLQDQLVMVNIANSVDEKRFIECLHKWTDNLMKSSLESVKLISDGKSKSKTAFMKFTSLNQKKIFLDFIKKQQKRQQNFIPILNEDIFELSESDVNRADVIEFRTPMTNRNREIFKAARDAKKINKNIEGVWISKGAVHMRIKNVKTPQQLNSIEQIKDILASVAVEKAKNKP